MTVWQWTKATAFPTFNVGFVGYWLVQEVITPAPGGWRVLFLTLFSLLLALALWQWPRSVGSYRRMVESERALGAERARFIKTAVRHGYPMGVIFLVDHLIQEGRPMGEIQTIIDAHRPRRRRP